MLSTFFKKFKKITVSKKSFFPDYLESIDIDSNLYNQNYPKANFNSYRKNVIVHRCVNLIAQSASHIPWIVYHKGATKKVKIDCHPVYSLLNKPSPSKGGAEFFEQVISNKLL